MKASVPPGPELPSLPPRTAALASRFNACDSRVIYLCICNPRRVSLIHHGFGRMPSTQQWNYIPQKLLLKAADALKKTKMELKPHLLGVIFLQETHNEECDIFSTICSSLSPRPPSGCLYRADQGPGPAKPASQVTSELSKVMHNGNCLPRMTMAAHTEASECVCPAPIMQWEKGEDRPEGGVLRSRKANKAPQAKFSQCPWRAAEPLATLCPKGALPSHGGTMNTRTENAFSLSMTLATQDPPAGQASFHWTVSIFHEALLSGDFGQCGAESFSGTTLTSCFSPW